MRNVRRWPSLLTSSLLLITVVAAPAPAAGPTGALPAAGLPVPVGAPRAGFRWPVDGPPRVVRRFDPPPRPWLPGHRGVDLAAAPGSPVRSSGTGQVLFAGLVAGRPVVSVGHAGGLRTTYEPVRPVLRAGDRVEAGQPLGFLLGGHPGCPTTACLHWGLRQGEVYLDPLALLGLGRVRLLPVQARAVSRAGRRPASRSYSSARL
jgi:murein DD-endopeptidase MepM/ murein hydrolase activator NlpD